MTPTLFHTPIAPDEAKIVRRVGLGSSRSVVTPEQTSTSPWSLGPPCRVQRPNKENSGNFSTRAPLGLYDSIHNPVASPEFPRLLFNLVTPCPDLSSSEVDNTGSIPGGNNSGPECVSVTPSTLSPALSFPNASLSSLSTPTPGPRLLYPAEVDDLFFEQDIDHNKNYRRVVIQGIPKGTHVSRVLHQIKGQIVSASLVDTLAICGSMTTTVEFLRGDDAVEFVNRSTATNPIGLIYNGDEILLEPKLVETETHPLNLYMTRKIEQGATRFIEVLNITEDEVISALRVAGLHQASAFQAQHTLVDLRFNEPAKKLHIELNCVRKPLDGAVLTWGKCPPVSDSEQDELGFPEHGTPNHLKQDAEIFEMCIQMVTKIKLKPLDQDDLKYPWEKLGPPEELPNGQWNGVFEDADEDMMNSRAYRRRISEYENSLKPRDIVHPYTGVSWTRGPWSWSVKAKDQDLKVAEEFADSEDPDWVAVSEALYDKYGYDSTCRKIVAYAKWKRKQPKGHWANP